MKLRTFLTVLALGSVLLAVPTRGASGAGAASSGDLFAQPKVHRIKIELGDSALESLRKDPKRYVKATVREGATTLADVGIRLKGSGTFQTVDKKPSFSIKFNEFVKGQEFHGRGRILLSNSHQDPTYLCEAIGGEIFRAAGVPAAKATFARVEINGRDVGLYVLTEAVNKDFLSQYFKKAKGNLYEGSNNDVTDKLEKDGGDDSVEQNDVRALATAAKEPDLATRWKKLNLVLDINRFIDFAAVEVFIAHHDGYTMDRNNYRIYHDPASGQIVFLPHDLDQIFGKSEDPIIPNWKGLVAKSVLTTPAGQKQYLESMAKLLGSAFKPDAINTRLGELAATIRPTLAEHDSAVTKAFDDAVTKLRERITNRAAFIEQQLKAVPPSK
jgi:spore coat protein CotH